MVSIATYGVPRPKSASLAEPNTKETYLATINNALIGFNAQVKLLGPGKDGMDGVDAVTLGYVQDINQPTVTATYAGAGTAKYNPDPAAGTFLDSGRTNAGTGGSSAFTFSSTQRDSKLLHPGQSRVVLSMDAPGINFSRLWPTNAKNQWASVSGSESFTTYLTGYASDSTVYDVIATAPWTVSFVATAAANGTPIINQAKSGLTPAPGAAFGVQSLPNYGAFVSGFNATGPSWKAAVHNNTMT